MNWSEERIARLRLARTNGIGPLTFSRLLSQYDNAIDALKALPERAKAAGRNNFSIWPKQAAEREIRDTEKFGARILLHGDDDYPALLAALTPPPPILSVKGNREFFDRPNVAMVGARNASAAAIRLAFDIAHDLGSAGWVVTSGLARGIDTSAHKGALATGTIAVIAGGVDHIYPPQNTDLYERIAETGLIVSESLFGYEPRAHDFPRRNRLITGLASGVVVVEAAKRSGSLISARTALEQGREVMAVPGSPLDARTRGSNGLIRDGATLIESAEDIIAVLDAQRPRQMKLFEDFDIDQEPMERDSLAPGAAQNLLALLSAVPVSVPDLANAANMPTHICATLLVELELTGVIQSLPGGLVRRNL